MKVEQIRTAIRDGLKPYFLEHGFKFRQSDFEFTSKLAEVSHIYKIYVHAMTEWFNIVPAAFVGCPQLNKLFNKGLMRNVRETAEVIGFGVRNVRPERGSYSIDRPGDIPSVLEKLKADYQDVAVPFFSTIIDLRSLEKHMNKRCENGAYRSESCSVACKGLIAAKLVGNPDFEIIFRDSYEFWKQAQGENLAAPISIIKKFLDQDALEIRSTPASC